jgi:hypothetical protein
VGLSLGLGCTYGAGLIAILTGGKARWVGLLPIGFVFASILLFFFPGFFMPFMFPLFAAWGVRERGVWAAAEVAGCAYVIVVGLKPVFIRKELRFEICSKDVGSLLAIFTFIITPPFIVGWEARAALIGACCLFAY